MSRHKRTILTQVPHHRRLGAALLALAVLLQMSYVPVSFAACSTMGTQRIAFGKLKDCAVDPVVKSCCASSITCSPGDAGTSEAALPAIGQKCCDIDSFEAEFFSFKEDEQNKKLHDFSKEPALAAYVKFAERPLSLRHVQQHLKIPPSAGRTILAMHARLNV